MGPLWFVNIAFYRRESVASQQCLVLVMSLPYNEISDGVLGKCSACIRRSTSSCVSQSKPKMDVRGEVREVRRLNPHAQPPAFRRRQPYCRYLLGYRATCGAAIAPAAQYAVGPVCLMQAGCLSGSKCRAGSLQMPSTYLDSPGLKHRDLHCSLPRSASHILTIGCCSFWNHQHNPPYSWRPVHATLFTP
jgi:hypothetical protein